MKHASFRAAVTTALSLAVLGAIILILLPKYWVFLLTAVFIVGIALQSLGHGELVGWSPKLRAALNKKYEFVHPEHPEIQGLSHIQWTGKATKPEAHARNAVFYGDKAIDRSPCGTGTSARMAQLAAKGKLAVGDEFVHESIIGSLFKGRVEAATTVANRPAIIPSIAGWARMTGYNTIFIDDRDPFAHGFVVT